MGVTDDYGRILLSKVGVACLVAPRLTEFVVYVGFAMVDEIWPCEAQILTSLVRVIGSHS